MSIRERALAAQGAKFKRELVESDQLGEVWMQEVSAATVDQFRATCVDDEGQPDRDNMTAKLVRFCAFEADGAPAFESGDEDWLGELPYAVLSPLWDAAAKLNGMTKEAEADIRKNLPALSTGDASASPRTGASAA